MGINFNARQRGEEQGRRERTNPNGILHGRDLDERVSSVPETPFLNRSMRQTHVAISSSRRERRQGEKVKLTTPSARMISPG